MSSKMADFFLKAVAAAKRESHSTRSRVRGFFSSECAVVVKTAKVENSVVKNPLVACEDECSMSKLDFPSTSSASSSLSCKKVIDKKSEAETGVLNVTKNEEAAFSLEANKECAKKIKSVAKTKQIMHFEAPSVISTSEDTLNYFLSLLVESTWRRVLRAEMSKDYMRNLMLYLEQERKKKITVLPPRELIFHAFNLTPLDRIRVVLIGQDPYHGDKQAHGLCFSVSKGTKPPPSLVNIYKELKNDIPSFKIPEHGCLIPWASQGVFMLNATLTVEAHKANSHSKIGWQQFTDEVIRIISRECKGVVFLLWGGFAHKKEALIDHEKHAVIKTAHPSPLSARFFFGCRCFSRTNEALAQMGRPPVDWAVL